MGNLRPNLNNTLLYLVEKVTFGHRKGESPALCLVKEMNHHEKNSHFSIGTSVGGCIFSDGRSVGGNMCCDHDDLCCDHERSVHELHHVNVLLLSVPRSNVLLPSSHDLCGYEVLRS